MAQICEYTKVRCPFCGSAKVVHYAYGEVKYTATTIVKSYKVAEKVHMVRCLRCSEHFSVQCQD